MRASTRRAQPVAGTYQPDVGGTVALVCPRGHYCLEGSISPTPCPGGTFGNGTGLTSVDQCVRVARSFWAPLGSPLPETCGSGFYCPGYGLVRMRLRHSTHLMVPHDYHTIRIATPCVLARFSNSPARPHEPSRRAEVDLSRAKPS